MAELIRNGWRAALAVAALSALAACSQHQTAASAPGPAGERYIVRLRSVPELKPVAATITSRDMAEARARIAGTLVRLNVKEGDLVHRGEVIAVVADARIGFETEAYDAQIQSAAAQNLNAQAELARTAAEIQIPLAKVQQQMRSDEARAALRNKIREDKALAFLTTEAKLN